MFTSALVLSDISGKASDEDMITLRANPEEWSKSLYEVLDVLSRRVVKYRIEIKELELVDHKFEASPFSRLNDSIDVTRVLEGKVHLRIMYVDRLIVEGTV